ncbi:methyltransferase domain-containing protein [Roseitranquillus sediminis]|uniref:methyltransferase domain-containing protein n=1 Tax=Roseitranquillus sediminis TaxID=2809051 RepID=UPI001D0C40DB|nr:methyltransferase domain-containing protein [Roseitranquillus sediminis]MBM9593760.1 methyltransferase domain-containing protein [Roseitranquillus sediminis]
MQKPPDLVDLPALVRNRRRARAAPALFLHEAVADEAQERLNEVNRAFTDVAVVTPWPELWRARLPAAHVVPPDETLALEQGAHDLVIHALALHWANDPVGQLVQSRRALRPDGLLLAALFGGQTLTELRASLAEAEARLTGGLSPRVLPMGEIRDLGALLQRAGLALPVADSATINVNYRSAWHLMCDLRAMGEQNALAMRRRRPTRRAIFDEANRIYASSYSTGPGRVRATFEIVWLTGWGPSEDQPQPLRPGSATARLADALGTSEHGAGDSVAPEGD